MAKRFTDTGKWDDPFFLDMPANFKLVYLHILDKCDAVGVWKVNKRLAVFCVGDVDWDLFVSYMGKRIHIMNGEKWWLTKFCDFQYGELSEDSKSKPVISHINLLKKHRLWKGYTKGIDTLKEKEQETVRDKETVKEDKKKKEVKHQNGEYKNVLLTDAQLEKLKVDYPATWQDMIKNLDEYIQMKGAKYKDHNLTMRKWANKNGSKVSKEKETQYTRDIDIQSLML